MATKPILFSAPMVQAIRSLIKRQTRRTVKWDLPGMNGIVLRRLLMAIGNGIHVEQNKEELIRRFAKIKTGDILWVRETWAQWNYLQCPKTSYAYKADGFIQRYGAWERDTPNGIADVERIEAWKPSIFMPKEAARLFLKVTNVRVERLQDITEEDAISEGILRCPKADNTGTAYYDYSGKQTPESYNFGSPIESFKTLWKSINGPESWDSNPWVWVYEFEQVEKPKDFGHE